MSKELWISVDEYLGGALVPSDRHLDAAVAESESAGLPPIQVAPVQGKLLNLLAKLHGTKSILEIGTLGGYSTIWLARALPADGRMVTLEIDPKHAEVARKNVDRAGLAKVVEIKLGPALELLPTLSGPFDFIFIDADKANIPSYFEWSLKLSRPGTVIIIDNVVRGGEVANPASESADVQGVRRVMDMLAAETRVDATAIQTVGSKGYDGFALVLVGP